MKQTKLRTRIEEILDQNISYGYEFQMSDYASSEAATQMYEKQGRKEVARAVDKLEALIAEEIKENQIKKITVKSDKAAVIMGKILAFYGDAYFEWLDKNSERLVKEFHNELDNQAGEE